MPRGRNIPLALRRFVADRDEYRCAFVGPKGHRCGETRGLQVDHIMPVALGGETIAVNLRSLCSGHNRHEAAKRLGAEYVAGRREVNERARAQQKMAKQREAEREAVREAGANANANAETEAPANVATEPQAAAEVAAVAARAAARRESDADVIAAMRSLRCSLEEAQLGVARTSALADGPIEARITEALRLRGHGLGRKENFRPSDTPSPSPPESGA